MAFHSILIVGCGNMAGAMLEGWLAAGIDPARFTIVDPARELAPGNLPVLREPPAEGSFDAVLLGVKPQMLGQAAPAIEPLAGLGTMMFSLLAGVELASLRHRFPRAAALVRVMPNLAVSLGKAPIALAETGLDENGRQAVAKLMRPLGTSQWIAEEKLDLVTALAGSGPAFLYRFIDALSIAAARLGLSQDQARELAIAMTEGAAALAARSEHGPGRLAEMVASPGGVTRKGLDVLDEGEALVQLMTRTLRAARDRSAEMAREFRD